MAGLNQAEVTSRNARANSPAFIHDTKGSIDLPVVHPRADYTEPAHFGKWDF